MLPVNDKLRLIVGKDDLAGPAIMDVQLEPTLCNHSAECGLCIHGASTELAACNGECCAAYYGCILFATYLCGREDCCASAP